MLYKRISFHSGNRFSIKGTAVYFLFLTLFTTSIINAQINIFGNDSTSRECSHRSLDLTVNNSGISFGNSQSINGIRFNVTDCGIKNINGINITFWKPEESPGSVINGLSFGVAPYADELNGVSIGLASVLAGHGMTGFNLGGLANVSEGNIYGINVGGLALVSKEDISGINFGGLAQVSQNNISGINFAGLALVSQGSLSGINIGGLASVSNKDILGINFGSLALVSQENIYGINAGGLATVAKENIYGINFGGLAVVSEIEAMGITIGGLAAVANGGFTGINIGGLAIASGKGEITGIKYNCREIEIGLFCYGDQYCRL